MGKVELSIVIPVYNSSHYIDRCINSVLSNKNLNYEIIAVDNGSKDNSVDILENYPVKIVKLGTNFGPSFARNRGAEISNAGIIVFLDSDVLLDNDSLTKILDRFKNNDIDILQCVYDTNIHDVSIYSKARNYYKTFKISKINNGFIYGINSYCFAVRKKVFESVGGFNPLKDGVEDIDFALRAVSKGYRIFVDRDIKVKHLKNYSFISLLKTDFKKVFLKARLMLEVKADKMTFSLNKMSESKNEILSLLLAPFIASSFITGVFWYTALILSLAFFILFVLINFKFLKFILKHENIFNTLKIFSVYYTELLISFFALLTSVLERFLYKFRIKEFLRLFKKIFLTKNTLPEQLTIFITDRCNLKCKHCFYWKNLNKNRDFSLDEFKVAMKNVGELNYVSLTGGEPFLRDDIDEIVKTLIETNKVRRISIPTNGYLTERIIRKTREIINIIDNRADLIIKVSIDGLDKEHNLIRGVDNSFDNAVKTVRELKKLSSEYRNFKVGVLITYSSLNQKYINDVYEYVKKLNPDTVGLNFVRGNPENSEVKNVDVGKYIDVYRKILKDMLSKKTLFHRFYHSYKTNVINTIESVLNGEKVFKCYAGRLTAVIDSNLDVYPCEILNMKMGNLKDFNYNFKKLWFSESAEKVREYIDRSKCNCSNECNIQINSFFNFRKLLNLVWNMFGNKGELCELR